VEQYLIIPDIHCPFHDLKYTAAITRLLKHLKTSGNLAGLVQLGDFVDFWQVSSYPKDPGRRETILEDLECYLDVAHQWAAVLPQGAVYHQLEGNHEHRLSKFIASHAAPIHQLVTSIPAFLARNWKAKARLKWHDYKNWKSCKLGDCYLMHGFYYNQHVAASHLLKYKRSTIFGHTHRLQYHCDGEHFAATLGHGSDEHMTAHQPTPTHWTQAAGLLTVSSGRTSLQVLIIRDGEVTLGSKKV